MSKSCKNCLHYEACDKHYTQGQLTMISGDCSTFTDLSEWVHLPDEEYTFTVRGDIALGIIIANCRAAEAEKALDGMK